MFAKLVLENVDSGHYSDKNLIYKIYMFVLKLSCIESLYLTSTNKNFI